MVWTSYLIISASCLAVSIIAALIRNKTKYKSGRFFDPSKILVIGVAVSATILFIPISINEFKSTDCGFFEIFLNALQNMLKLFVVDNDYSNAVKNLGSMSTIIYRGYTILFSILFVLAPALTFGFVLSFFKNLSAYKRYFTHYFSEVYIFSELNEKSIALAKSLYENKNKKRFFVFTDVFEKNEEESYELIEKAKELGAVCFKKDIVTINFSLHSILKKCGMYFFVIGSDHDENMSQTLEIIEKYKQRKNAHLYLFSTRVESEILLANAFNNEKDGKSVNIKVRRVNEVNSLIMRNLYDNGYDKIFASAHTDGSENKQINALIVGMGDYGTEMTKALSWFGQMDGYDIKINTIDIDENAEQKFLSLCPELMALSGKTDVAGEAKYEINIHQGVDVNTAEFDKILLSLPQTTYVLVALGDDEKNIFTAVKIRALLERKGFHPEIQAVISTADKKYALNGALNFKGQQYDIDYIGDVESSYSEKVILNSELENIALARHMRWGDEESFWKYDYNYRSSISSAIHRKMKSLCGVAGIDKTPDERSDEELLNIRILEHCRWNAYMRSEGYVYGGTIEKSGRNDLAKKHNCLVPFDELPLEEQIKDDD